MSQNNSLTITRKNNMLEYYSRIEAEKLGINIESEALEILSSLGFDSEKKGTKLLAELVDCFYHERKGSYDDDFYNLDIFDNQHFLNMNEYYGCGLKTMHREIKNSIDDVKVTDNTSYTELISSVAKNLIEIHNTDNTTAEKLLPKIKKL